MTGTWRPAPATKPAHLSSSNTPSPQTLAALQGATSAFAQTSSDKANDVKVQHAGPSSPPTTSPTDQPARGRQFAHIEQDNGGRSPSRGRHLDVKNAYLAGARAATSNASSRAPAPHSTALDRSPSSIAARIASSSSSSPARSSPATSPRRGATLVPERGPPPKEPSTKKELVAAKARVTPQRVLPAEPITTLSSAKSIALDFDRVPQLDSPQSAQTPTVVKKARVTGQNVVAGPNASLTSGQKGVVILTPESTVTPRSSSAAASEPSQQVSSSTQAPKAVYPHQGVGNHAPASSTTKPEVHQVSRPKPNLPAPRKTHTAHVRGPLEPSRTGPLSGETREQAISRMADAMVASSLASTRSPSPMKAGPLASVKSSRRSHSASDLRRAARPPPQHTTLDTYQNMSSSQQRPPRPMKQTLRKQWSDKEDEDSAFEPTKRGRRHLVRKHPNMHHEGDRKRWRDKITEMERKRYEGVFAANRGLLLKSADARASPSKMIDPDAENNKVVNIIVRDIWERSRLSKDALKDVYDLVAPEGPTSLNREQFVVGLWLIDQKLKGRKLPVTVSPSVWASVRHSTGIKIK